MPARQHMAPPAHEQPILSPTQIVGHPHFTAREKIGLLEEMRGHVAARAAAGDDLGFDAQDIDAAIAEVRRRIQDGVDNDAGPPKDA